MEFFWKLEVNTAKQWGDITASRGAISTASLWLGLSQSLSSFRKKDVRRVLSFSLQEQSSTFCLSELLLRKKAKKIMLSSKNLGFFARQTQCSVNNGMRIMCVDKQSSVQSVNLQYIPRVCLEFFLTAANWACLCLEQEQRCPTWESCGGWTALPQNGSCDTLKHAVNTACSIHWCPTRASRRLSRCLSFGLR